MSTNSFLTKEARAEKMAMIINGVQRLWSRRRRGLLLESSWWADAATSRGLQGWPSQWPLGSCRRCPFDSYALFPHFCSVFPMAHYSDSPSREFGELTIRKSISRSKYSFTEFSLFNSNSEAFITLPPRQLTARIQIPKNSFKMVPLLSPWDCVILKALHLEHYKLCANVGVPLSFILLY